MSRAPGVSSNCATVGAGTSPRRRRADVAPASHHPQPATAPIGLRADGTTRCRNGCSTGTSSKAQPAYRARAAVSVELPVVRLRCAVSCTPSADARDRPLVSSKTCRGDFHGGWCPRDRRRSPVPVCTAALSDQEALSLQVRPLRHSIFAGPTKPGCWETPGAGSTLPCTGV